MKWNRIAVLAMAAVGIAGFANQAQAAFILRLTPSSGPVVTVTDGGAGDSDASTNNQIVFSGLVGPVATWIVNITAAVTNSPGDPSLAKLSLTSLNITSPAGVGPQGLTVEVTSTGYNLPVGTGLTFQSSFSGTVGQTGAADSASLDAYADGNNNSFGEAGLGVVTPGTHFLVLGADPLNHPFTTPVQTTTFDAIPPVSDPYSLTSKVQFSVAPGANLNFTAIANVTPGTGTPSPEPATLGLLGMGGLLLVGRRKGR